MNTGTAKTTPEPPAIGTPERNAQGVVTLPAADSALGPAQEKEFIGNGYWLPTKNLDEYNAYKAKNGTGPGGAAAASAAAVATQTQGNRPDQNTPFGFSHWTHDANGNWTQTSGLSPDLQAAAGGLESQAKANALRGIGTGEDARNQAITGAYNQATSRLDPQWAQRDEHLSSALANQGLDPNSQAYRNAMLQQSQARNDAYGSAMNSAIGQGTAAQQATFNENLQAQQLPYQQMGALHGLGQPYGFNAGGLPQTSNPDAAATLAFEKQARGEQLTADETAALLKASGNFVSALQGASK